MPLDRGRFEVGDPMERRQFVQKLGLGSAAAVAAGAGALASERQDHDHTPVTGALATVTVSFGQWRSDMNPSVDRYGAQPPGPPYGNGHLVIPQQATVKVGGTVNFIIAGVHQVIVYAPGKRPDDVNTAAVRPAQGTPNGMPALINDTVDRLYAGEDPTTLHSAFGFPGNPLLDRVEVVQFHQKGMHLVICGVLPHFVNDKMYGWVKVVGDDGGAA